MESAALGMHAGGEGVWGDAYGMSYDPDSKRNTSNESWGAGR